MSNEHVWISQGDLREHQRIMKQFITELKRAYNMNAMPMFSIGQLLERWEKTFGTFNSSISNAGQTAYTSLREMIRVLKKDTNTWIQNYNRDLKQLKEQIDAESHNSDEILAKLKDLETLFENHYHKKEVKKDGN